MTDDLTNSIDLYKPNPSILSVFDLDETLPDNELAFATLEKIVLARKTQDAVHLSLGKMLKLVRDRKLYKSLDFDNFTQFLHSEEVSFSREKAYMYIRVYEHYSEFLELDEGLLKNFPVAKLSQMLPVLRKIDDKEEQIKEIERMNALTYSDFVMTVKKTNNNDKPTIQFSNELDKWVIYFWGDRSELVNKGMFSEQEVEDE